MHLHQYRTDKLVARSGKAIINMKKTNKLKSNHNKFKENIHI